VASKLYWQIVISQVLQSAVLGFAETTYNEEEDSNDKTWKSVSWDGFGLARSPAAAPLLNRASKSRQRKTPSAIS